MRKRFINILALGVKELYSIRADPVMTIGEVNAAKKPSRSGLSAIDLA